MSQSGPFLEQGANLGPSGQPRSPEEVLGPALNRAILEIGQRDPKAVSRQSGADFHPDSPDGGYWVLRYWGEDYRISQESGQVQRADSGLEAGVVDRVLMLHYLLTADGTPMESRWRAFRELSGAMAYDAAFQGRSSRRLAQVFGSDLDGFVGSGRALQGESLSFGDASFLFRVLPRLWMAVVLYLADDEFGASANVLFDGAADHYLPTEDLAVLGGMLSSRLIRAAGNLHTS